MDALTFIAHLIEHLATPAAIIIGLTILLKHIPDIRGIVRSVRYKDFEVNLRHEFGEAEQAAAKIESKNLHQGSDSPGPNHQIDLDEKVMQLAQIDGSVAILSIWRNLERSILALIQHNGLVRFTSPNEFVDWLTSEGKLSKEEFELFTRLRHIRNAAVHGHYEHLDISLAQVVEFNHFANVLAARLEQIRSEPDYLRFPIE